MIHDDSICVPLDLYENDKLVHSHSKYNLLVKISISDNCFIGIGSIILPGVHIGINSIVCSGSEVPKDVLAETVVARNPAKAICSVKDFCSRRKEKIIRINLNIDDNCPRADEIRTPVSNFR